MNRIRPARIFLLSWVLGVAFVSVGAHAQAAPDQWTWMSGTQQQENPGVYGTVGVGATTNLPYSRYGAASWTDNRGNMWLFGGGGEGLPYLNDLWKYDPATGQWTWVSGGNPNTGAVNSPGIYTGLGAVPGSRSFAFAWADNDGFLWLFGGEGVDATGGQGMLGDLWKFEISTSTWIFVGGGNQICGGAGNYGTEGKPAPGNWPGCRSMGASWTDLSGNLWLFSGINGYADLWEYNKSLGEWAWMSGSNESLYGVYGSLGAPNAANYPGSRIGATSWTDKSGNLWLFGGNGYGANVLVNGNESDNGDLNDLWMYSLSTNEWAWMSGNDSVTSFTGVPAVFGKLGVPAAGNVPASCSWATGWVDNAGNLWLFGGEGATGCGNLWVYETEDREWGWMNGPGADYCGNESCYMHYGSLGIPAVGNLPGPRTNSSSWTESNGNLWLFGGGGALPMNDLWELAPSLTATYQTLPPPTFSPAPGNYKNYIPVTMSDAVSNASIFYTTDGSTPAPTFDDFYNPPTNPLWIYGSPETVRAVAHATNYYPSAEADATYNITLGETATVTVTPASLNIGQEQALSVAVSVSGASGNPTPTGTVTLTSGSYTSAATALVNGSATINIPANSLAVGSDTLTANYSGDTNYDSGPGSASITVTAPPSFTLNGPAVTVAPGATTGNTSTITLTPTGGFTGSVALTAAITSSPTGAQYLPTVSFGSTTPVAITGATAATATLTVSTTATTTSAVVIPKRPEDPWYAAGSAALAFLLFIGNLRRRSGWRILTGMVVLLLMLAGGVLACGSGGSGSGGGGGGGGGIAGTTAGTYTVTITGTSGAITGTGTATVTVQ
jgi:hypothetical protein